MTINWEQQANPDAVAETASVLQRARRGRGGRGRDGGDSGDGRGGGPESLESTARGSLTEKERMERLKEALARAEPAVPPGERAEIKQQVLAGAEEGLAKALEGERPEHFSLRQHVGLEAVIITSGERPSLFVREGFVDLNAPDIGDWDTELGLFKDNIQKVISSVGRIDIPADPGLAGTCFVIAPGLVLTNRHVLEEVAKQDASGTWVLNWPEATTVDFIGEDGAVQSTRFPIREVVFAGPDPINRHINFNHLDMAILRMDPDGARFPEAVTFERDAGQPEAQNELYVVGFPGRPKKWFFGGTPEPGTETTQVISTIFNNKFGVKRLAPGKVKTGPGKVSGDANGWICTHDASTLGGNSGSCIADLSEDGVRIVGLHFGGSARAQNYAHVAARLHEQLSAHSARFLP
jgi:hypothetical protein